MEFSASIFFIFELIISLHQLINSLCKILLCWPLFLEAQFNCYFTNFFFQQLQQTSDASHGLLSYDFLGASSVFKHTSQTDVLTLKVLLEKKKGKRLLSSVIDRCLFWFIGLVVTLATIRYEYIRARVVCKAWEKLETSVSWPERVAHMPCLSGWLIAWGNRSHCGVLTISQASSCSLTASHMTWIWAGHLHFVLLNRGFVSVSFIRTASPFRTIKEHWPLC